MRISEFGKQKLRSFLSLFNPQFAVLPPQLFKHFSLGQQRILFIVAIFLLGILYFRFYYHRLLSPPEEIVGECAVEVSGDVPNPGIFIFRNPPSLKEAIEKAGGLKEAEFLETAASSKALETGTLITVVKESRIIPPCPPFYKGGYGGTKVKLGRMEASKLLIFFIPLDLNRVSAEDLCLIPGIGESLAREIVAYRGKRRGFRSVEELKNVKGIGEKKYQTFRKCFTVRH